MVIMSANRIVAIGWGPDYLRSGPPGTWFSLAISLFIILVKDISETYRLEGELHDSGGSFTPSILSGSLCDQAYRRLGRLALVAVWPGAQQVVNLSSII